MSVKYESKYFVSERDMIVQFETICDEIFSANKETSRSHHLYCVGTPKTGTHSIDSIFSNFKSKHEPLPLFMIELLRRVRCKNTSSTELIEILLKRDQYLDLDMESSHFNSNFLSELKETFPNAKFIFLYRDAISWLDSWINHHLNQPKLKAGSAKQVGRQLYYHRNNTYSKYDTLFLDIGLQSLDSYLEFWAEFNNNILDGLPKKRSLLLPTEEINNSKRDISRFCNIPIHLLNYEKSHEFRATKKHKILNQLDQSYLHDRVQLICRGTLEKLATYKKNI